jgi:hypothetical protein
MRIEEAREHHAGGGPSTPGRDKDGGQASAPRLSIPNVYEVRQDQWEEHDMGPTDAIRIKSAGADQESYDFYVNMDNVFLVNQIRRNRTEDPRILEYWFKYGLALVAASMLKIPDFKNREVVQPDNEIIENLVAGLARVMVPVVKRLHEGPQAALPAVVATGTE